MDCLKGIMICAPGSELDACANDRLVVDMVAWTTGCVGAQTAATTLIKNGGEEVVESKNELSEGE